MAGWCIQDVIGQPANEALSVDELGAMQAALQQVSPLSDQDIDALLAHAKRVPLPKGTVLLRAGEAAQTTGFVLSGGLREYYVLDDGTERTKGFNLAGGFAGSLSDLISGAASRVWIVAEAPSVLVNTPWPVYAELTESRPAWARFARKMAEALYMAKVEREYELLALDAAQRYQRLLTRWPTLEAVFSQRDIASYIGVTPVHLSRLRSSKA